MESGVSQRARDMYDDINKLELYVRLKLLSHGSLTNISKPGLLCERSNYDGCGFGFGYTMV
jgi:hypothetical protein